MKSIRKTSVVLGIAMVCLTASSLKAQVTAGAFTLPSQTYWGTAVLPAGNYTFSLDYPTLDGRITISQGMKVVAFVSAQGAVEASSSGPSSMLTVEHRVLSLHLANLGLDYDFPRHKNKTKSLARRTGVQGVAVIPVSAR